MGSTSDRRPLAAELRPDDHVKAFATIIFLSYRFSQGGIGTQNRLLLYLEKHFHPELIRGPQTEQVHEATHRLVSRYFLDQQLHPSIAIPWDIEFPGPALKTELLVDNELLDLFGRFVNREVDDEFAYDPVSIGQSILTMDADYLRRPGGRGGASKQLNVVVDPFPRDPYDSFYLRHAVLGVSTNTVEYDAVFAAIDPHAILPAMNRHGLRRLHQVIRIYLDHHPTHPARQPLSDLQYDCEERLHGQ